MELRVARETYTNNSTIGRLFVNGQFECFTLEDVVRRTKIPGETAIPAGKYKVVITFSPKFKRQLPLLVDVPGYSGVRIHPGNTKTDTLGCLLVGQGKATDAISASRAAFDKLLPRIQAAAAQEEVVIELVNEGDDPLPAERGAPGARGMPRKVARAAKAAPPVSLGTPWQAPKAKRSPAKKARGNEPTAVASTQRKATSRPTTARTTAARKGAVGKAKAKKTAPKKAAAKKAASRPTGSKSAGAGSAAKQAAPAKRRPAGKQAAKRVR